MKQNVGNTDRIVRIAVGIALLGAVFLGDSNARWLGLIGLVPLVTGLIRWCPAYALLGTDTCGVDHRKTA
ncbi:MAG: DUF2892 domain-containing protein [Burkholderiales bacterium]